jgi:hypothetical protein
MHAATSIAGRHAARILVDFVTFSLPSGISIHAAPVPASHHDNDQYVIADFIDDAIDAPSSAIPLPARELLAAGCPRIVR